MDKFPALVMKFRWFMLATIFTVVSSTQAGPTLDSMNSLTPAPINKTTTANKPILIPTQPDLNVSSFILMDADSGKILAGKNIDTPLPPASLTKLMTLYVVSNALKTGQIHLTDKVKISKKAWQTGGSRMFVQVGDLVSVEDLLKGIIVDSGNDACVALSEYVAGSEDAFVSLMNQQAAVLGMKNSHFTDSNGLPNPNHYVSAHDFAILTQHLINDFPEYYSWYSQKNFTYNNITQPNRNQLLWAFPYADGLKTGHTDAAGYCLVGSAKKDGMRLISVVMNAPSTTARTDDSIALLTYGFNFFKTYKLYSAGETVMSARTWQGKNARTPVGLTQNVYITLPIGQYEKLQADSVLLTPLKAPLAKGANIGVLEISLDKQVLVKLPLVALQDNPRANFFSRMLDSLTMSLQNMLKKIKF